MDNSPDTFVYFCHICEDVERVRVSESGVTAPVHTHVLLGEQVETRLTLVAISRNGIMEFIESGRSSG